jgi:anti-sigma B factor antagonist
MLGELTTEVTDRVRSLVDAGHRAFLLNLAGVSSLDSHGLGDLVGAYEAAVSEGGVLKLANVQARVAHPLQIMNLSERLQSFETEEDALRSFGSHD